jgi:Flp pilus assembly protein TadD
MCGEEGYGDDEGDVHYWMGRCLERLHMPAEALKAFGEAIRLDPDNAPAYQARGKLYQQRGENDKAQADFAKAKELESEE